MWLPCRRPVEISASDLWLKAGTSKTYPMATYTPPPYFPQGSLAPADKGRYRKFKLMMIGLVILLLGVLGGVVWGVIYLARRLF